MSSDFSPNTDLIEALNRPMPIHSYQSFEDSSLTRVTAWFDEDCRINGARQALEALYKNEYKSVFMNDPPPKYAAIVNHVDTVKASRKRSYVFITIRPLPASVEGQRPKFEKWCEDIPNSFRFIDADHASNVFRWETVDKNAESKHFHGVFKLSLAYSPAQIRNQLTSRKDSRRWFQPYPKVAVDVKKISSLDLPNVTSYIIKND